MPTEDSVIRILLVEEEALVRTAIRKLLESWSGFEMIGEAATKDEALELIHRLDPDAILLSLPGEENADIEAVDDLARASERARLLVLIGECDEHLPTQVVLQGARGIVQKNKAAGELRKAIQKVCGGEELWLDRTSLARLVTQVRAAAGRYGNAREKSQLDLLTDREREVVALVIEGYKNKQVGERLFISETTVRHHVTTIFNKLNISNRFELFACLHRHRFSGSDAPVRNSGPSAPRRTDSER